MTDFCSPDFHHTRTSKFIFTPAQKKQGCCGAAGGARLAAAWQGSISGRAGTAARAVAVGCQQDSGRREAARRRQRQRKSSGRQKRQQRQKPLNAHRGSAGSSGERHAAVHQSRTVDSKWRRRRRPSSSQPKNSRARSAVRAVHALNEHGAWCGFRLPSGCYDSGSMCSQQQ